MSPKSGSVSHADIRASVRAYLDRWEAWESEHKKEAAIPNAEMNALSVIAKRPFEQELEDGVNYINPLLERAHFIGPITKRADEEVKDPSTGVPSFRTSYKLPNGRGIFPREGHGFDYGEEAPLFTSKKRARQFAAKCALTFLFENPKWPHSDGVSPETETESSNSKVKQDHPAPSSQNSPTQKRVKVEDAEVQEGAPVKTPASPARPDPAPAKKQEPATDQKVTDQKVLDLAREMAFDAPRYMMERHEDLTWSCRPMFQNNGRMPGDLGFVSGAASQALARTESAGKVLAWLQGEKRSLQAEYELLLGEMDGAGAAKPEELI